MFFKVKDVGNTQIYKMYLCSIHDTKINHFVSHKMLHTSEKLQIEMK